MSELLGNGGGEGAAGRGAAADPRNKGAKGEGGSTLYAYAVSFDQSITRSDFTDAINKSSDVANWYTCMPNTVFVVSALSANQLSKRICAAIGVGRLIVLDVNTDRDGWLPKKVWDFLSNPRGV